MTRFTALLAALVLTGCASTPVPNPAGCDLTVTFGSYASGIDTVLRERIVRTLASDHRVARTEERRWGREGESTICIVSRNNGDVEGLSADLNAMIQAQGDLRGPTTVGRGSANFPPA